MSSPNDTMQAMGRALTDWYYDNRRDLPWRNTRDPYAIWVSEIMLQQTRVETVLGYYGRFMAAFPTAEALAAASSQDVLKAWEGLGYYSRAVNLHRGARFVVEHYAGGLPGDRAELEKIPGIGRYTAGAIASIAFDLPEPAVDGNVLRVLSRACSIQKEVDKAPVKAEIEDIARSMIPAGESASFCQALMELGALLCVPAEPKCPRCPLEGLCAARGQGIQNDLPLKAAKKRPVEQPRIILVVRYGDRFWIRRRQEQGLLARLWEFPGWDQADQGDDAAVIGERLKEWGMKARCVEKIGDSRHVFTHRIWLMRGWHVVLAKAPAGLEAVWARAGELGDYPFPAAMRYFLEWAQHTAGKNRP